MNTVFSLACLNHFQLHVYQVKPPNFFLPSHSCGAPTFRRDDNLLNGNLVLEHPALKAWSLQAENLGIYADTLTVLDMVAWPVAMFEHNLRFLSGPNS